MVISLNIEAHRFAHPSRLSCVRLSYFLIHNDFPVIDIAQEPEYYGIYLKMNLYGK